MENNNLDALLEDLQSSVARTQINGPGTTARGYREITRTYHSEGDGLPPTTSRDYQIEYLTPANSTTILSERSSSPGLPPPPPELLNNDMRSGSLNQSYKTVSYENYHTSSKSSETANAALMASATATTNAARHIASLGSKDSSRLRGNINELDTLLDDLNASQRQGYTSRKEVTTHVTRSDGSSGPLPPPLEDPIPLSAQHVSRATQRSFSERRYGSVGRQSPSPHRYVSSSLDRANASPLPKRSSSSQRDIVFSSSRNGSPSGSPAPSRSVVHKEVYRYEAKTSSGGGGGPNRYREPSPGPRPPSPTLERITNTVRNYDFNSTSSNVNRSVHRPPSPASFTPGSKTITTSTTYNYNSSNATRPEPPRTPPPHRSPSPVSFPSPPEPHGVPFGYTQTTTTTTTRHRSPSPQPYQKFSPSDPSSGGRLHYNQISTQKYSSSSQQEQSPLLPRPFPTPSPDPGEQRPPKQLDELMSSFETDSTQTSVRQYASSINAQTRASHETAPPAPATPPPPPPPQDDRIQTRNVAGPPVYYPPGVDMFSKKEETVQFAEGGGKYKGKAKAKYEYESKSKMKEKSSQGGAVVPVCLPLCCAMPCTIM